MALLPGQTLTNGVSNFIFGTNMGQDYSAQNVRNNATMQGHILAGGFTLMRCAIPPTSTNAYIDQTYQACVTMGCDMLAILIHDNPTWNQHLVSYLGNRCNLYEFANEPDLYPISGAQYYNFWAQNIPTLRGLNPGAAFIGPVLGVFANLNSFVTPWLTDCLNSGNQAMMPDGISYHIYPCTGAQSQSTCAPKAGNFSSCYTQVDTLVKSIIGRSLPQCLTEWNIDAAFGNSYITDPTFCTTWTHTALDNMVSAGFAMACQFEAGSGAGGGNVEANLISSTNPYSTQVQYQPMVDKIVQYLQQITTPSSVQPYMVKIGESSASGGTFTGTYPSQSILDIQNLGATTLFYQVTWPNIDPGASGNPSSYVWANLDGAVSQCNQAGIDIVVALFIGNPAPSFPFTKPGTSLSAIPSDMATYAQNIARAYTTGSGSQRGTKTIKGLYIGNEDYDSGGSGGQAADLVAVLKAVYPVVKAVNSSMLVIAGAKIQRNSNYYSSWFDTLLNNSTGAYTTGVFQADAITFHYHTALPLDPNGNSLSLDPSQDVGLIPSWEHCWKLVDAKRKQYNNNVDVWADENGENINTNQNRPAGSVVSDAVRWNHIHYEMDSARLSGVVSHYGIYTLAHYAGYAAPDYRDGQSLIQGPLSAPRYGDTFVGMKAYISNQPTWGTSSILHLIGIAREKFFTKNTKSTSPAHNTYKTSMGLRSKAGNVFLVGLSGIMQLMSRVRNRFLITHVPTVPDYAHDTFLGNDGKDSFTAVDGKDTFIGVG